MVLDRNAFMSSIEWLTEGKNDDNTLQVIANLTETFDALSDGSNADIEELKAKHAEELEEKDNEWREKIKNMFFHGEKIDDPEETEETEETEDEPKTFDELFEESEEK